MSNTSTEYKKLVAATLVPLYGVHPIIYNFEMNLVCTVLNLKQEIVESMEKHNHRIKILLNAYLKQIETMLSPNNFHIHLFVIPTEIIDMCGKFYDEYYLMTIDIKMENLAVFPRNNDRLLQNEASLQHWSHSNDKFCVYELMDDAIVTSYFMSDLNGIEKEFVAVPIVNILRDIYYKKDEVMLVAKLPIHHAIDTNIIKRIVTDTIRPYMKQSNDNHGQNNITEPFTICLGDYSVNAMSAICVFLNSYVSRAKIKYFMENEEVPQNLEEYTLEIGRYNNAPNTADTISVIWTLESSRLFKSHIFAKCEDTWNNHVCAMELFEDDDIDTINKIQNMFD